MFIEKYFPWCFFNGDRIPKGFNGVGGVLYFSNDYSIFLKLGLGHGSNKYVEMKTLLILFRVAQNRGIRNLQVYEDSSLVIKWMKDEL